MLLPECGDQRDGHLLGRGGRSCEGTEGGNRGPERQPVGQPERTRGGGKEGHFVWRCGGERLRLFQKSQVAGAAFIRAPTLRMFVHQPR